MLGGADGAPVLAPVLAQTKLRLRSDNDANFEVPVVILQVTFESHRVTNPTFWIIDKANEYLAIWVFFVPSSINQQFFTQLAHVKACPRFFGFHDDFFVFQQEVDPR